MSDENGEPTSTVIGDVASILFLAALLGFLIFFGAVG